MLEICGLDAGDPLAIVDDFSPGLDEGVEDDVAVEVDDADSGQAITLLRQDALAVKGEDLCLSKQPTLSIMCSFWDKFMHLLSSLRPLVEHIVEDDWA